jgi:hypothetical protein
LFFLLLSGTKGSSTDFRKGALCNARLLIGGLVHEFDIS